MSDKNTRIGNLPPTTAGLNRALTVLQEATGCPDGEAERLLSAWDALVIRYGEVHQVRGPLPIRTGDQVYQSALALGVVAW